jgi:hypothetical protein
MSVAEAALGALRPGGTLVIEDIDFTGHLAHPDCAALHEFSRLYTALPRTTDRGRRVDHRGAGVCRSRTGGAHEHAADRPGPEAGSPEPDGATPAQGGAPLTMMPELADMNRDPAYDAGCDG